MARKTKTPAQPYVPVEQDLAKDIVMAETGVIKDKQVDPRKLIGTVHVKKWLADTKINGEIEKWIKVIKKAMPTEEVPEPELTPEDLVVLEECKKRVADYLKDEASASLKAKILESTDEMKNLKDVSSSMKFKFSKFAYESITHVINLMVREILVFTCDNCASQRAKLTKPVHVPWDELRDKPLAGLYMNTKTVFDALHPVEEEEFEEEPEEDVPTEEEDTTELEEKEEDQEEVVEVVKVAKPRLFQYISNTFKEIVSHDARFKGLLLGKEVASVIDSVVFQTLDRFAKVIKSLLDTANSKTVNERLALLATKILLQDHIQSCDDDVRVILDVVQARLESLKLLPDEPQESDEEPEKAESKPVKEVKFAKTTKKASK